MAYMFKGILSVNFSEISKERSILKFQQNQAQEERNLFVMKLQRESSEKYIIVTELTEERVKGFLDTGVDVEYSLTRNTVLNITLVNPYKLIPFGDKVYNLKGNYQQFEYPIVTDNFLFQSIPEAELSRTVSESLRHALSETRENYYELPISADQLKLACGVRSRSQSVNDILGRTNIALSTERITGKYYMRSECLVDENTGRYFSRELLKAGVSVGCSNCLVPYMAHTIKEYTQNLCPSCLAKIKPCCECGARSTYTIGGLSVCTGHARMHSRGGYHSNSSRESPMFIGTRDDSFPLYLGVELEVDRDPDIIRTVLPGLAISHAKRLLEAERPAFTRDGSLNDETGFEMISQPKTLDAWHESQSTYAMVFKRFVQCALRGHDAVSAGFHIHVSREAFGEDVGKIFVRLNVLFYRHFDKILVLSRRKMERIQNYAQVKTSLLNKPTFTASDVETLRYMSDLNGGKHDMISCDSDLPTLEFRIFRSTLNIETFMATIDFVAGVCKFVNENDFNTVNTVSWEDLLTSINSPTLNAYYERINRARCENKESSAQQIDNEHVIEPDPEEEATVAEGALVCAS